jgi:serine/threonine-protein kinase
VHGQGVVHRDIKPANLKVGPDGKLALVDFGIAKAAGHAGAPGRTAFGAHGAFTPHMAAPEQVVGQATGPRTDLYAVGATFAYLLTAQLPPTAQGLPAPVGPALARALAPDPAGRWADAAAMRAAIGVALPAPAAPLPFTRRDIRRGT